MARIDITGQKFGRLTAVSFHGTVNHRGLWNCVCDCGNTYRASGNDLRSGDTVSCGCKKAEGKPFDKRIEENKNINTATGCWEWTGEKDSGGYGRTTFSQGKRGTNKSFSVHRLSYQFYVGEITDGLHVLHKCDNRCCFNPEHLFLGTHQDNMNDMHAKGRGPKGYKRKKTTQAAMEATNGQDS